MITFGLYGSYTETLGSSKGACLVRMPLSDVLREGQASQTKEHAYWECQRVLFAMPAPGKAWQVNQVSVLLSEWQTRGCSDS